MMNNPVTPWDDIFECNTLWGHMKRDPVAANIETKIMNIADITDQTEGEFCVFGKLKEKNLRDMNDPASLTKRGGQKVTSSSIWLNIMIEDDTGSIMCRISRWDYEKWGKPIIENMEEDKDWLLIKGKISGGFRIIIVEKYRHLTRKKNEKETIKENDQSTVAA